MSRVGRRPIGIPTGIKASITGNLVTIEGPKGKLEYRMPEKFKAEIKENSILVSRPSDSKQDMSRHGLTRTLLNNMVKGVTNGYSKELEIRGVGFKAQAQGNLLKLNLGFTHTIDYAVPQGITVETPKPNIIVVKGANNALVGEVAAEIRDFYRPEPYKGKGIRYVNEYVRHKAGKTVA